MKTYSSESLYHRLLLRYYLFNSTPLLIVGVWVSSGILIHCKLLSYFESLGLVYFIFMITVMVLAKYFLNLYELSYGIRALSLLDKYNNLEYILSNDTCKGCLRLLYEKYGANIPKSLQYDLVRTASKLKEQGNYTKTKQEFEAVLKEVCDKTH